MHRCASAPAIRESVTSWHLTMVINAIASSPKVGKPGIAAAAPGLSSRHSAVDLSVLSQ
jgi:hypothetical protein